MDDNKHSSAKPLPTLSRPGWDDFDMEQADGEIEHILAQLQEKSEEPGDFHDEITIRLADILSGLMAYAHAQHMDLTTLRKAMH